MSTVLKYKNLARQFLEQFPAPAHNLIEFLLFASRYTQTSAPTGNNYPLL